MKALFPARLGWFRSLTQSAIALSYMAAIIVRGTRKTYPTVRRISSTTWNVMNPAGSFADDAVAVSIFHELVGRMFGLNRRDAVMARFAAGNRSVVVVVVESQHVAFG